MALFKKKRQVSSRLSIDPPAPKPNRAGLALVIIVKNEAEYLKDWLAFHTLAGADHIIAYDNDSTDRTLDLLAGFQSVPSHVLPWNLKAEDAKSSLALHQQILAYTHAIQTFGPRFERMTFLDIDEFLVPVQTDTIGQALDNIGNPANLSLPWTMFGHSGHKTKPNDPVPFAYTQMSTSNAKKVTNFKCIIDPCDVTEVSVHKFKTGSLGDVSFNTLGRKASETDRRSTHFLTREGLQLNHYYLRSEQEMNQKIEGGAISGAFKEQRKTAVLEKRDLIENSTIENDMAIKFLDRHGLGTVDSFEAYRDSLFR